MRLINADVLIVELQKDEAFFDKEVEEAHENPNNCTEGYADAMWSRANGIRDAIVEVYDTPTVDIDRPQGEWIIHKEKAEVNDGFIDFFPTEYECSNCGLKQSMYFIDSKPSNFCPNCGAQMKGANDE